MTQEILLGFTIGVTITNLVWIIAMSIWLRNNPK